MLCPFVLNLNLFKHVRIALQSIIILRRNVLTSVLLKHVRIALQSIIILGRNVRCCISSRKLPHVFNISKKFRALPMIPYTYVGFIYIHLTPRLVRLTSVTLQLWSVSNAILTHLLAMSQHRIPLVAHVHIHAHCKYKFRCFNNVFISQVRSSDSSSRSRATCCKDVCGSCV